MLDFYLSRDFQLSIKNPSESTDGFKIEVYYEILSKYDQVIACVCFDKKQTKQVPLSFMDGVSQEIFISDIYEYELSKSIDVYCICCDNIPPYDDISSNTVEIEIPPKKDAVLISKEFNKNGVYNASEDNADGYSDVTIDVPDQSKDILNSLIDRTITTITSDATSIGSNAFQNCTSLTEVSFPNVTSIGRNAFQQCASLTEVSFPNVTSIGSNAFYSCTSLTEVSFPKVTSIGSNAFQNCTTLTEANFPEVTFTESFAFSNCASLTEVSFPNVTSIGSNAFYSCTSLTEVSFPKVTSIGSNAFQNCTALKYFDMSEVSGVPSISSTTFKNTTCIFLFRDQTQLDEYANATNWSTLTNRFQIKGAIT